MLGSRCTPPIPPPKPLSCISHEAWRFATLKTTSEVNSLCPGTINTELYQEFLSKQPDPETINKEIKEMHPLGIGEPEDIAWAAVYLASDESRYMTGAPMLVEGGILSL